MNPANPAAAAAALAWLASPYVDVDVRIDRDGAAAHAFDLFGGKDEAAKPELRWKEGSGAAPIVPGGVPQGFAELAERVSPAVVTIVAKAAEPVGGAPDMAPFEHFFGFPFPNAPMPRGGGIGSGFVLNEDGDIVTNAHVVRGASEIEVELKNGEKHPGRVVGIDDKTDIALVHIDGAKELTPIALGDSDVVRPGDWVMAIGNPFGLTHTVTVGIVSAKGRYIGEGPYDDFIQTDAAINPGNSGGPLLNLAGEVIGINTAIRPNANTVGFTIPINMAKHILPQLHATGRVQRAWLGVVIQDLTPELAEGFGLDADTGALVNEVQGDGPAQRAGLRRGDVIVEFDGQKIGKMNELPRIVANSRVDSDVDVTVLRKGRRETLQVRLGELPDDSQSVPASAPARGELGLGLQSLTPELAERLGVEPDDGVVISNVAPGSPAAAAGLRRGDLLLEVDQQPVASPEDVRRLVAGDDPSVLLLIRRDDRTQYVVVRRSRG